jgi:hypothetical protein
MLVFKPDPIAAQPGIAGHITSCRGRTQELID